MMLPGKWVRQQRDQQDDRPEIVLGDAIRIPPGLAVLGERQCSMISDNTIFGRRHCRMINLEHRLWAAEANMTFAPTAWSRGRSPSIGAALDLVQKQDEADRLAHVRRKWEAEDRYKASATTSASSGPYVTAEEWDQIRPGVYGSSDARSRSLMRAAGADSSTVCTQ